jgi:Zn-dependent protease
MSEETQGAAGGGNAGGPAGGGKPAPPAPQGMKPIHLFRVAGIDVSLHPAWFLVLAYFVFTGKENYRSPVWAGIECLGLFCIVLLHEFGHAFACRSTGGKANRIMLWPLGGVAYVQPPPRPGAFLWSIAAGPLVNVALIPVTLFFYRWGITQPWANQAPDLLRCARALAGINIGILMFNMLPIYPLDGGQIVQSLLWFVIGRAYSLMVVSVIGFVAAVAAVLAALRFENVKIPFTPLYISPLWAIFLAVYMIQRSVAAFKQSQTLVQLQRMRRVEGMACPSCGEKPFAEDLWACEQCQARFNPFVTGGVCPSCGYAHEKIACPFCRERNEIGRWRR